MKTVSLILVMATYLAVASSGKIKQCDLEPCVDKFSLIGTDSQFCNSTFNAQACIWDLIESHRCHGSLLTYAKQLKSRLRRISQCICNSGDCVMSSLFLSLGMGGMTYFMTYFK